MSSDPTRDRSSQKPRSIRSHNKSIVLSLLYHAPHLTVREIAQLTQLSKTTVIKILGDLIEERSILSAGKGDSTDEGGKRPERFEFNASKKKIIVFRGGRLTLIDLKAKVLAYCDIIDDFNACPYPLAVRTLADEISKMLRRHHLVPHDISGIVLAIAGIVDSKRGIVWHAVHSSVWADHLPMQEDLKRELALEIPIYLENDAAFLGFAELLDPENRLMQSLVTISVGYHTGGCVLNRHHLVHGSSGFVGEFGHATVDPNSNLKCICGASGCFEVMASPNRLQEAAKQQYRNHPDSMLKDVIESGDLSTESIFAAAAAKDVFARSLLDEIIDRFSILIRSIIVHIDPQKIILQGIYCDAGDYFIGKLHEAIKTSSLFKARNNLDLVYSKLDPRFDFLRGVAYFIHQGQLGDATAALQPGRRQRSS